MQQHNYSYHIPKQRTSQSMRMRGAQKSFTTIDTFLNRYAYGINYKNASIAYFTWVDTQEKADAANMLEQKLFDDLNTQLNSNKKIPKVHDPSARILEWNLNKGPEEHVTYIDELKVLPVLTPKPVVTLVYLVDFWLNGVPKEESLKSNLIAWLSPSSNSVNLSLNFPSFASEESFEVYRGTLQKECPVKIEDKYLHFRKVH